MNDDNNIDSAAEYLNAILKTQGVSVATVDDGWVFSFTKEKLVSLMEGLEEREILTIFVKSREKSREPVN